MDLDQLIRDADPAQGLAIDIPDPGRVTARGRSDRGRHLGSLVASAIAIAVAVGVVGVALSVRGEQPLHHQPPAALSHFPFGATLHPPGPTGVLIGSARLDQVYADPISGPAWGLRTYRTQSGMTCVQVGRTESGFVGAIGVNGAYGNDRLFHPFAFSDVGLGQCVPQDAHGHSFINLEWGQAPAAAGHQPCLRQGVTGNLGGCRESALRDVYFGLLGPDATQITYLARDGREVTQQARGRDGAYLIVLPTLRASCNRSELRRVGAPSMCLHSGTGVAIGSSVTSGEITSVAYRHGRMCHLPVPQHGVVRLGHCPVVGYAPPVTRSYTAAQVASAVTVRKLPARYYCQRPGVYRPADLPVPCSGAVPPGYQRFPFTRPRPGAPGTQHDQNLLVYVSWTARAPVKNASDSSYDYSLTYPRGCGAGGESSGTQTPIRTGQRVTRSFYVQLKCRGTYTGQITYIPNLGPQGQDSPSLGGPASGRGILLVGRFSFTTP